MTKRTKIHPAIEHLRGVDPVLARVIDTHGPYTLEPRSAQSPFHSLAHAIAHQQLNGTAANTILRRFRALYGTDDVYPEAAALLATPDARLRSVGFSTAKVAALKDLAAKTLEGVVPAAEALHALDDDAIVARLTQVRGIGRWTVEMMLIFQLGRPDVLPVDDFGVRNGFRLAYGLRDLPAPRALAAFGERWGPHRSAAAWYLWRAVDLSRAGKLPAPLEKTKLPRVQRKRRKTKTSAVKALRLRKGARRRART